MQSLRKLLAFCVFAVLFTGFTSAIAVGRLGLRRLHQLSARRAGCAELHRPRDHVAELHGASSRRLLHLPLPPISGNSDGGKPGPATAGLFSAAIP